MKNHLISCGTITERNHMLLIINSICSWKPIEFFHLSTANLLRTHLICSLRTKYKHNEEWRVYTTSTKSTNPCPLIRVLWNKFSRHCTNDVRSPGCLETSSWLFSPQKREIHSVSANTVKIQCKLLKASHDVVRDK